MRPGLKHETEKCHFGSILTSEKPIQMSEAAGYICFELKYYF